MEQIKVTHDNCCWKKSKPQNQTTLISEDVKSVALSNVKVHMLACRLQLAGYLVQSVSQSVSQLFRKY